MYLGYTYFYYCWRFILVRRDHSAFAPPSDPPWQQRASLLRPLFWHSWRSSLYFFLRFFSLFRRDLDRGQSAMRSSQHNVATICVACGRGSKKSKMKRATKLAATRKLKNGGLARNRRPGNASFAKTAQVPLQVQIF